MATRSQLKTVHCRLGSSDEENLNLNQVRQKQAEEKQIYQCEFCKRDFKAQRTLDIHSNYCKVKNSPEELDSFRKYECEFCGFKSNTNYNLSRHKNSCKRENVKNEKLARRVFTLKGEKALRKPSFKDPVGIVGLPGVLKCLDELNLKSFKIMDIVNYFDSRYKIGSKLKMHNRIAKLIYHNKRNHFERIGRQWRQIKRDSSTSDTSLQDNLLPAILKCVDESKMTTFGVFDIIENLKSQFQSWDKYKLYDNISFTLFHNRDTYFKRTSDGNWTRTNLTPPSNSITPVGNTNPPSSSLPPSQENPVNPSMSIQKNLHRLAVILKCLDNLQLNSFTVQDITNYLKSRFRICNELILNRKISITIASNRRKHFKRTADGKWERKLVNCLVKPCHVPADFERISKVLESSNGTSENPMPSEMNSHPKPSRNTIKRSCSSSSSSSQEMSKASIRRDLHRLPVIIKCLDIMQLSSFTINDITNFLGSRFSIANKKILSRNICNTLSSNRKYYFRRSSNRQWEYNGIPLKSRILPENYEAISKILDSSRSSSIRDTLEKFIESAKPSCSTSNQQPSTSNTNQPQVSLEQLNDFLINLRDMLERKLRTNPQS